MVLGSMIFFVVKISISKSAWSIKLVLMKCLMKGTFEIFVNVLMKKHYLLTIYSSPVM